MKRAILDHPNPNVGLVSVRVTDELPDGTVLGVFADFQTISGTPLTLEAIREIEAKP